MSLDMVYSTMRDKQEKYQAEARLWRDLPKPKLSKSMAKLIHKLADRLEPQGLKNQSHVLLQERTFSCQNRA